MPRCKRGEGNATETKFREFMEADGWHVTKRGWPDFICEKLGEFIVVEVKPQRGQLSSAGVQKLKQPQVQAMDHLTAVGVDCYVSDGERLVPFNGAEH